MQIKAIFLFIIVSIGLGWLSYVVVDAASIYGGSFNYHEPPENAIRGADGHYIIGSDGGYIVGAP